MNTADVHPPDPGPGAVNPDDDNPYDLLGEDHDEGHRWAFGTGFTDSLEGVDTSVPDGLDPGALVRCCLALGDDALIYSHRLQQWVARLPELEEETAVANIALDLLGQARMLLARAGGIVGQTEDQLAFFREEKEFRNVRLAEHADRDFAELVVRLLMFSTWRLALFESLSSGSTPAGTADPVLAAIAAKGVNELAYHRDYAASWVVRLGDGTALSHAKTQAALDVLWPFLGELFRPDPNTLAPVAGSAVAGGTGPGGTGDRAAFDAINGPVLTTAGLDRPVAPPLAPVGGRSGRDGVHTEAMGYILAELQSVARAHPDAWWPRDPADARIRVAAATPDPEIPTLTIEDLGILRSVDVTPGGIVVTITPTYSGCPAMREIAADVQGRLKRVGFDRVTVATQLSPPWSTDWITEDGHRKLAAAGIAPPSHAGAAPERPRPAHPRPSPVAPLPRAATRPTPG